MRILFVDDNETACSFVQKGLVEHGYQVDVAFDGTRALDLAIDAPYDFLILDVMLPDISGFELLQQLRDCGVESPSLFLSACNEVSDRIEGLNHGADDYLTKPFAFAELVARIKAIMRRTNGGGADSQLNVGDLSLDPLRRAVWRSSTQIELTSKEFELLQCLMAHEGHALSRSHITQQIWGDQFERYSNVIEVHINHLRKKVDHGWTKKLIHTVKGAGYVLEDREPGLASVRKV
jgi:DNA-binding response OmpR family regulator